MNYWGTKRACAALFPLLSPGARVVNVSSSAGWLRNVVADGTELKRRLGSADLTEEELDGCVLRGGAVGLTTGNFSPIFSSD